MGIEDSIRVETNSRAAYSKCVYKGAVRDPELEKIILLSHDTAIAYCINIIKGRLKELKINL